MKQQNKKNEKGFTMIELIIVVAIMAIIGAALVPMFNTMSDKARLTTDVTTIKTFQRQLEIFRAQTGSYPKDFPDASEATVTDVSSAMIKELTDGKYIDAKDLNADGTFKLQTNAKLKAVSGRCYLDLAGTEYLDIAKSLKAEDTTRDWVKNGTDAVDKPTEKKEEKK